jgi:hypothetical protein
MTHQKPTVGLSIDSVITNNGTQTPDIANFLICSAKLIAVSSKIADRPEVTHPQPLS